MAGDYDGPIDEAWYDEAAGPLVRPYAVTRGRTHARQADLELITLIVAVRDAVPTVRLEPEAARLLSLCRSPISVAELSAATNLPLGVVKVLLGDLIDQRLVMFRSALTPDADVLEAVLDGIRRL
jgi:hypothetical protein